MSVLTPADLELLSAYLDDALTPQERAALERRLAAEPVLHAELEALRAVVSRVRALPTLTAPRDFRLDPAVYGRKAPQMAAPRRVSASRVYYRWGSALSALAAAIMLAIGVLGVLKPPFLADEPAAILQQVDQEDQADGQRTAEAPPQIAVLPTSSPAGSPVPMLGVTVVPLDEEAARDAAPPGMGGGFGGAEDSAPAEAEGIENFAAEMPAEADGMFVEPTGVHFGRGGAGPLGDKPEVATGPAEPPIALQAPGIMPSPLPPGTAAFSAEAAAESGLADDGAGAAEGAAATGPVDAPSLKSDLPTAVLAVTEVALLPTPTPAALVEIAPARAGEDAPHVEAPAVPPGPAIFIGAGVALLALAGVFLALSRRK